MGWKGTLRSIQSASNRMERAARTRQRELEKKQNQLHKMQELERAAYEVQVYENYLDVLLSIHKECGNDWNWSSIQSSEPPLKPLRIKSFEVAALAEYDPYKPGAMDKLLKRVDAKREELSKAIDDAKRKDEQKYQDDLKEYEQEFSVTSQKIGVGAFNF